MYSTKKNLILSAVGIGLQTVGSICLIAAALGIGKEINQQIKKLLFANYQSNWMNNITENLLRGMRKISPVL